MSAVMTAPASSETFNPTKAARSLDASASPVSTSLSVVVFAATTETEPPLPTTPMTDPATPSPEELRAVWFDVIRLSPSCTFSHSDTHESVMSLAVIVGPKSLELRPAKYAAELSEDASPVSTEESDVWFAASTEVSEFVTAPIT
jgi:hypothetical protein